MHNVNAIYSIIKINIEEKKYPEDLKIRFFLKLIVQWRTVGHSDGQCPVQWRTVGYSAGQCPVQWHTVGYSGSQ